MRKALYYFVVVPSIAP